MRYGLVVILVFAALVPAMAGAVSREEYARAAQRAEALARDGRVGEAIDIYKSVIERGIPAGVPREEWGIGPYGMIASYYEQKKDFESAREWRMRGLKEFGPGKGNLRFVEVTSDILRTYTKIPADCPSILAQLDALLEKVPEPNTPHEPAEANLSSWYAVCGNRDRFVELTEKYLRRTKDYPMDATLRRKGRLAAFATLRIEYVQRRDVAGLERLGRVFEQEFPQETTAIQRFRTSVDRLRSTVP